ncbi:MAG: hypothetical protein A2Y24_05990 [Clostridiales bacterium GWE2_32_10]|nr:MAG: hypothetical protein A2Y24_05990 [Clostridiales bacterium GWE2_32_10]
MTEEIYKLTHPQLGIWNVELFHHNTSVNNIVGTVKYEKEMDIEKLEKAINILIEQNDALRIRVIERDGQPFQYIKDYTYEKIRILDYTGYTDEQMEEAINSEAQKIFELFELVDTTLYDFAVVVYNDGRKGVYFKGHHFITDAMSIVNVCSKLTTIYSTLSREEELKSVGTFSYIEFIKREEEYKNSKRFQKDKEYWLKKFETFPEFTELKAYNAERADLKAGRNEYKVPKHLTKAFHEYCASHGVTPYAFLMSTLVAYLARITQKEDITIGTPILNRNGKKERETIGMFISVSPLRVKVDLESSFVEHTKNVEKEIKGLLMHQAYPYDMILSDFRDTHETSDRLYDLVFSYQNAKFDIPEELPYETKWWSNGHNTNSLTVHVSDRESDGTLIVEIDYLKQLFTSDEIDSIFKHMFNLLAYAIMHSEKKIYELEILTTAEKKELLYKFNDTYADYPRDKVVHQLFEEQVERTPDNIAIVFEDSQMTYKELNEKANQLARILRNKGVGADKLVGVMVNRSLEMVVGILAILKAGGAYVPIDPEYPEERIKYMLDDADVKILLTQRKLEDKVEYSGEKIFIELGNAGIYTEDSSNLDVINKPNDLVYVIYTSGSTGQPKGVMVEHRNLMNFIYGMDKELECNADKKIVSVTTICFDIFALELYLSLHKGMKIYIANEEQQKNPMEFNKLMCRNKINIIQTTASRIKLFTDIGEETEWLKNTTDILVGGEPCHIGLLKVLQEVTKAKIYNMYGPTETTVWSTIRDMTRDEDINIGKPIVNTQIYVLDKYNKLLPKGIKGELCIGGDGVTRGYLNKETKTKEKFIKNDLSCEGIVYKSGDLAIWEDDGNVKHYGRLDNQVKINGFRIEIEEIENVLNSIVDIKEAVVIIEDDGENIYLMAYIIGGNEKLKEANIREYLFNRLPYYMIPRYIRMIKYMPLTQNGKIDRKELQKKACNVKQNKQENISKDLESRVIKILEEITKSKKINLNQKMTDLHIDSLKKMELATRFKMYGIDISIQDMYKKCTLKTLIQKLRVNPNNKLYTNQKLIAQVANIKASRLKIKKIEIKGVFITGITGFVGMHVLKELIETTNSAIYCIIRASEVSISKNRLIESLNYYFEGRYIDLIDKRIFVFKGDITEKNFGLDNAELKIVRESIDTVVHLAATVRFYGEYDSFYKINILGTRKVINFCKKNNKVLNYMSTVSVTGKHLVDIERNKRLFTENRLYIGQKYKENPYVRSKYEAELEVLKAIEDGLDAKIFRLGIITWRKTDDKFQIDKNTSMLYLKLEAISKLGMIPRKFLRHIVEVLPVDECAKRLVNIMKTTSKQKVFHISDNCTIKEVLESYYKDISKIKQVSIKYFDRKIKEYVNDNVLIDEIKNISDYYNDCKDKVIKKHILIDNKLTQKYINKIENEEIR